MFARFHHSNFLEQSMRGTPLRTGTVFSKRGRPMILGMCNPSKVKLFYFKEEFLPLQMYTCLSQSPLVSVVPANRNLFGMHELQDDEGNPTDWAFVDPELLYGPNGWCEADEPAHRCTCLIDGVAGPTCDEPTGASKSWCKSNRCWPDTPPGLIMTLVFCEIKSGQLCIISRGHVCAEMVCPNQCSGRGECWFGFCKCHDGW